MNVIAAIWIVIFLSLFDYLTYIFSVKYQNDLLRLHIAIEINKSIEAALKEKIAQCYPLQYDITVNWVYENQVICSSAVVISQN